MTDRRNLHNVSPIDGRYSRHLKGLDQYASEHALIRYRVQIEIEWLLFLADTKEFTRLSPFNDTTRSEIRKIYQEFDADDSSRVSSIEVETNHDLKAVEYFLKDRLREIGIGNLAELLHFGCTSEDINNLAYGLMLQDLRAFQILPKMQSLIDSIQGMAKAWVDVPMLSHTHGQPASPTTAGKEMANFVVRLIQWRNELEDVKILGKMNGAVGNFNAHVIACPECPWDDMSRNFVLSLGLNHNPMTTQIEPHDSIARYFNAIAGFNQSLLDLDRDCWSYISIGYFKQKQVAGEVGSSTMPHKVNPIDFENSEGNIGVANALARHLADKLQVSRWQRDLSDSTALRNVGTTVAHTLIAISSANRGLGKLELNHERLEADLDDAWEILGEAVQTVMRAQGMANPYERVKELTRGQHFDQAMYLQLLEELDLPDEINVQLRDLTPAKYVGLAAKLANNALK